MKISNQVLLSIICAAAMFSGGCVGMAPVVYVPMQYDVMPVVEVDPGYYYNGYYYSYGYYHNYGRRSQDRRPANGGKVHQATTTTTKVTVRTQSTGSKH